MKVYLTMGRDGRILVQARVEQGGVVGDLMHYVGHDEQFNGVGFDQLAQATPGSFDLPEQPDLSNIQPNTTPGENPDQQTGQAQ